MDSQPAGQFKLPPPKFRKKLSIPLKPKPVQTLLVGGNSLLSAAKPPEPASKRFTSENLPEGIELLNSNLYIGFQCMYCDAKLTSETILKRHIDGTEHQKKLLLKKISGKKEPEKIVITPPKPTLAEHLKDTSHPVVGLDFVAETRLPDTQPTFDCKMCGVTCNFEEIKEHVVGIRHCLMYLQMVESKRIEEIRSQYKKKVERNQEILKFAAQVEKERGRGTVKLILPEMLNKESSKKTDSQDDKEKKDVHGSVKRTIEEPPSSSRKKPLVSKEIHNSKSNINTKYHSSNDPNTKQHGEDQEKELLKEQKKQSRWGGYANPSALSTIQLLSKSSSETVVNTAPSESHSSSSVKAVRKTSLLRPQPKKPLYKPPRSFLLPSDIIRSQVPIKPSFTQAAPPLQIIPQPNISVKSAKTTKTVSTQRSHKRFDSMKNPKTSRAAQLKTHLNSPRHDSVKEASQYQSRLTSMRNDGMPMRSKHQSQENSMRNETASKVAYYQTRNEKISPLPQQLRPRTTPSPHLITGLLNHTQQTGENVADIAALKNLCSFIISNTDDAENVMEVISSLTQSYLQYKTRALTNPVKELLIQSLKDGSEGLQIILKRHGVDNIEPLGNSGDINNDTTRCASNVLRQFSSKWEEEPDDSSSDKSIHSSGQGSDVLIPNSKVPATQTNEKSAFILNSSPDGDTSINNSSKLQQNFSNNWKEVKSIPFLEDSSISSEDYNGLPLRSDKTKMFDR